MKERGKSWCVSTQLHVGRCSSGQLTVAHMSIWAHASLSRPCRQCSIYYIGKLNFQNFSSFSPLTVPVNMCLYVKCHLIERIKAGDGTRQGKVLTARPTKEGIGTINYWHCEAPLSQWRAFAPIARHKKTQSKGQPQRPWWASLMNTRQRHGSGVSF